MLPNNRIGQYALRAACATGSVIRLTGRYFVPELVRQLSGPILSIYGASQLGCDVGKIPGPIGDGRYRDQPCVHTPGYSSALIIDEEEGSIFLYCTAHGAAELVAIILGPLRSKVVPGRQTGVAQEFKGAAVQSFVPDFVVTTTWSPLKLPYPHRNYLSGPETPVSNRDSGSQRRTWFKSSCTELPFTMKPLAVSRWPLTDRSPGFGSPDGGARAQPDITTAFGCLELTGVTPGCSARRSV